MTRTKKLAALIVAAVGLDDLHCYGGIALAAWGVRDLTHPAAWAVVAGAALFYLGRWPITGRG